MLVVFSLVLAVPPTHADDTKPSGCVEPKQVLPEAEKKEVDATIADVVGAKAEHLTQNQVQLLSDDAFQLAWFDYSMCKKKEAGLITDQQYQAFMCQVGLLPAAVCG